MPKPLSHSRRPRRRRPVDEVDILEELSGRFIAKTLFSGQTHIWVDNCVETILDRPTGGSGDSCVVSRLTVYLSDCTLENQGKRQRMEPRCFIVKKVLGASERHRDRDALKTEIKRISYKVEGFFLWDATAVLAAALPFQFAKVRFWKTINEHTSILIEDDLVELGYTIHSDELSDKHALLAMDWLASFHSTPRSVWNGSARVWDRGGYWSRDKRSEESRKIIKRFRYEKPQIRGFFDGTFAARLMNSAESLSELLYPGSKPLPFTSYEESLAYNSDDEDSDRESDREIRQRREVRQKMSERVPSCLLQSLALANNKEVNDIKKGLPNNCIFFQPTLIHGDFKPENIFFSENDCAACDFQWTGFGLGVLDIVSFVFSSSLGSNPASIINSLLDQYCHTMRAYNPSSLSFQEDRLMLRNLFDWGVVDYSRYVMGSGMVYDEDIPLMRMAQRTLHEADKGKLLGIKEYRNYLQGVFHHI